MASRKGVCKMSVAEMQNVVRNASRGFDSVKFTWHGGEPMLAGLEFYETAVETETEITRKNATVFKNTLQTNGTLINGEWLEFFNKNKFSVGVSYDAPPDVQRFQRTMGDPGIEAEISHTITLMREKKFPLSFLCVVTKRNVLRGSEIYRFFSSSGATSYSLLPLMSTPNGRRVEAPTNEELFELYRTTFELWVDPSNETMLTLDPIYSMVQSLLGIPPQLCSFSSSCLKRMVTVAPDGTVMPCGSFSSEEFVLGNVFSEPLIKILSSKKTHKLRKMRSVHVNAKCLKCAYLSLCRGGCREASYWHSGRYDGDYPYCEARQETFRYIQTRIRDIISSGKLKSTPLDVTSSVN